MEVSDDAVSVEETVAVKNEEERSRRKPPPSAAAVGDGVVMATKSEMETGNRGDGRRENETPPDDDCCPICFGSFTIPCRANCGHWYCGSCILQFWSYSTAARPCKCPMCVRHITKLTPEASLQQSQEQEVKEVLAKVRRYNRLFVGGLTGLIQVHELPTIMKKMIWSMMDPDRNNLYLHEVRLFALFMSILYTATEFDFIPTGSLGIMRVFDYGAVALVITLRLVGIFQRRRMARRVRNLAAAAELEHQ
ncbi:PREDICTED: E3 ubiquitin-protein ligase RNF170 isoform X2 [Tarenaya hassleriana]|uniref:E3 ubiquitin-protein ligase RNF170 isoform X2 n=1 Tax=Tarenaya hassleriana TaxID=28532 RepID=UPI00053C983E|nr:PREDICTED: E3 ubiquitin-protein ligase RNF170 isoform X2 [Tarenaya hassleriana]